MLKPLSISFGRRFERKSLFGLLGVTPSHSHPYSCFCFPSPSTGLGLCFGEQAYDPTWTPVPVTPSSDLGFGALPQFNFAEKDTPIYAAVILLLLTDHVLAKISILL